MIPLRDDMQTRRVPVVNYLLIAANILVFVMQWLAGPQQEALVYQFALIPAQLTSALDPGDISDTIPPWIKRVTSPNQPFAPFPSHCSKKLPGLSIKLRFRQVDIYGYINYNLSGNSSADYR